MTIPIWKTYLRRQCDYLERHKPLFHANSSDRNKVAVIVEPRKHDMLVPVIRNVMHYVGDGWNLEVVSNAANIRHLSAELKGCTYRTLTMPYVNMSQALYNGLLLDPWFWWQLKEEHVLIFQTDCVMLRSGVDVWMPFDYVGANYFNPSHTSPKIGGIQGGFSLRKRSAMLECLEKVSWSSIQYHRTNRGLAPLDCFHEDIFFTHACEILRKRVPPSDIRKLFSIEAEYHRTPIAHHGTTKNYFTEDQLLNIISQSEGYQGWSLP